MGSCISKNKSNQIRHLTNSFVLGNLTILQNNLVQLIIRFNGIHTISNSDLETLILQKNKKKAILLKKKILILDLRIKELQKCLAISGKLKRGTPLENKKFLSQCKVLVEFFKDNCLLNTNTEILLNNSKAIRKLEKELDNYYIDEKGLSAEIDFLLKTQEGLAEIHEGFKRKKYIKKVRID